MSMTNPNEHPTPHPMEAVPMPLRFAHPRYEWLHHHIRAERIAAYELGKIDGFNKAVGMAEEICSALSGKPGVSNDEHQHQ